MTASDKLPGLLTQRLKMHQVAALGAVQQAAGRGECERPRGVQNGTMHSLLLLGLIALREQPRGRLRRGRTYAATNMWRMTNKGRAVLASPDPASALLDPTALHDQVAREIALACREADPFQPAEVRA